jgi:hypothetical protein
MQPITLTRPSLASSSCDLHDDATCTICAASSPVLRLDWKTLARLTSRQSKPLDLDACPTSSSSSRQFCGATDKPGEIVNLGFKAKPRNTHSLSPSARCRLNTVSPDLSIVQSTSTQHVLDHPQSSTPSFLLLPRSSSLSAMLHLSPTHHETSKCISPHETDSRVEPPKFLRFKFKPKQVNYSSQIKPRYSPLGFS